MAYSIPRNPNLPPGLRRRPRPILPGGRPPPRPPKNKPPAPVPPPAPLEYTVTPDYANLLKADPNYQSLIAQTQAGVAQAASRRKAALKTLLSQYGGQFGGDLYGDISESDKLLALENPFSAVKQLQSAFQTGTRDMKNSLRARGGLRSGELGYGQGQMEQAQGQAEYETAQQFMQAMADAINQYQGTESEFFQRESDVIRDISGQIALANPVQKGKATFNAMLSKQYGQPVYKDPSGGLWTPSPNGPVRFTPPAPSGGATIGPQPGLPGYVAPGLVQPAPITPTGVIPWP